jgi:hypothetical protein
LGLFPELYYGEDFILWAKAIKSDNKIVWIKNPLVHVNLKSDFNKRRFNFNVLKQELILNKYLMKIKYFTIVHVVLRLSLRCLQFVIPNNFKYFVRKIFNKF